MTNETDARLVANAACIADNARSALDDERKAREELAAAIERDMKKLVS